MRASFTRGLLAYSLLGAAAIHDQSNGWFYVHAPGIDEPLLAIKREPTTYIMQARLQFVSDGLGQMVAIADSAGGFTNMYAGPDHYTPGTWATAGMTSHAQTFDPQRLSADSGAISSFRTRQYDPSTGSWLQEDHAGLAGGVNLYQYNGNDPNSGRDPFGTAVDSGASGDAMKPQGNDSAKSCVDRYSLSSMVASLSGSKTAGKVVGFATIGSVASVGTDLVALSRKGSRALGTTNRFASGFNMLTRSGAKAIGRSVAEPGTVAYGRIVRGFAAVGDNVAPAGLLFTVGDVAYELTIAAQCATGILK